MKITIEVLVGEESTLDWWDIAEALETVTQTRAPIAVGSTGTVRDKAGCYAGQWTITSDEIGEFKNLLSI